MKVKKNLVPSSLVFVSRANKVEFDLNRIDIYRNISADRLKDLSHIYLKYMASE